jgi:hypothetical protein
MKKIVLAGVLAVVLAAVMSFSATTVAAQGPQTWSVGIHFEYADGFSYDIILATGLTNVEKAAMLAECGRSHRTGSVVRYHCYPIAE